MAALDEHIGTGTNPMNHTFALVAATIYCYEKNYEAALRVLQMMQHEEHLEKYVYIFLM